MNQDTYHPKLHSGSTAANRFTIALLLVYLVALLWILILKMGVRFSYMDNREVNLVPFYRNLFQNARLDKIETIMNIIVFIPFGVYTGILLQKRRFGTKLLLSFLASFLIETIQFSLAVGAFDATDLVTNTTGGLIGLMLYELLVRTLNHPLKAQRWINFMAAVMSILAIVLLVMLKLNMLPVRYQ